MFYFSALPTHSKVRHVMHLHGHKMQVIKMRFPEYHLGKIPTYKGPNVDFKCTTPACIESTWSNKTWLHGQVPGIITSSPPLKDTIEVPYGGYVVVRLKTDNPGKRSFIIPVHFSPRFHILKSLLFPLLLSPLAFTLILIFSPSSDPRPFFIPS